MFRRLLFENWVSIFTLVAFITSASIYVSFTWRALRMRRVQVKRLSYLPLEHATENIVRHDS
ncbi:MAG: hypothetical protein QM760_17390 [Nibricoccus sp.]